MFYQLWEGILQTSTILGLEHTHMAFFLILIYMQSSEIYGFNLPTPSLPHPIPINMHYPQIETNVVKLSGSRLQSTDL